MKQFHVRAAITMAAVLFLLTACTPQPAKKVPAEFEAGQKQFHRVCANCHGSDALGKQTKAPGLIDVEYLQETYPDDEIRERIVDGTDKMPSQRNKVTDAEIDEIIKYLRYSQKAAGLVVEEDEDDAEIEEENVGSATG
ncbi:MAG: cytochrome c [Nitrospinae bacterium]|nr:cytochrome c [Nitrospinota bacterium]